MAEYYTMHCEHCDNFLSFVKGQYVVVCGKRFCMPCFSAGWHHAVRMKRNATPHFDVLFATDTPQPRPTVILPNSFDDLIPRMRYYNITDKQFKDMVTMLITRTKQ